MRLLAPGDLLDVSKTTWDGKDALAVIHRGFQVGWVPEDLVSVVSTLQIQACEVRRVGTDAEGNWTQLHVEIKYLSDQDIQKDKAALIPKADKALAVAELEMLKEAGIIPEGIPKRRRRS